MRRRRARAAATLVAAPTATSAATVTQTAPPPNVTTLPPTAPERTESDTETPGVPPVGSAIAVLLVLAGLSAGLLRWRA